MRRKERGGEGIQKTKEEREGRECVGKVWGRDKKGEEDPI